jgi:hypothetical protein
MVCCTDLKNDAGHHCVEFWNTMLCGPLKPIRGLCHLHLQCCCCLDHVSFLLGLLLNSEDGGEMFL